MAKKFVKISLAVKFRLLLGGSVALIIVAALAVPWYFMDLLAEEKAQRPGAELTELRLSEWTQQHPSGLVATSRVEELYTAGEQGDGRAGPVVTDIRQGAPPGDRDAADAYATFRAEPAESLLVYPRTDEEGNPIYRVFRAIRNDARCIDCHSEPASGTTRFDPDEFLGMVDLSLSAPRDTPRHATIARAAFALGGLVAGVLAFLSFAFITQRLVLGPVRHLRDMADRVADGDLSVRSKLTSDDELQHLGDGFNSMLAAIGAQHEKLRSANRALDLKLSELSEANVALFEANKVKSEFLANVSHELRTPLNSIIGFADLLADGDDDRIRRYGQNISTSAKSLMTMINDLLGLAKIEAGRATIRLDKVSVIDTCQTLVALTKPLADKKQQALELKLADELPLIMTDGAKLQQILFNLLSNAVKFTPINGTITVSAQPERARGSEDIQDVSIAVADTGPGIAEAEKKHIFEKFYQSDQSLTKQSTGTGLGLAISKELATLLGGRIDLVSSPGHGATFTVTLPVEPPHTEQAEPAPARTDSD